MASTSTKQNLRKMTTLRMHLEEERNKPTPNQDKIDSMMAEYKRLETLEHVKLVFGERGRAQ